jgi:hypothetical protein
VFRIWEIKEANRRQENDPVAERPRFAKGECDSLGLETEGLLYRDDLVKGNPLHRVLIADDEVRPVEADGIHDRRQNVSPPVVPDHYARRREPKCEERSGPLHGLKHNCDRYDRNDYRSENQ